MNKANLYRNLSRGCYAAAAAVFVAFVASLLLGCTLDQANRGLDTVSKIQAATTQPYVTAPASAIPYGDLALGIVSLVLAGLAQFFKSQRDSAQAHLDTAKAATGTSTNAQATAALVNYLDSTPIAMPPSPPPPAK